MNNKLAAAALLAAGALGLASCTSEKKAETASSAPPQSARTIAVEEGKAGGVVEDTFTVSAKVSDLDRPSRRITLTASDGTKSAFTAGPEIRNFDQMQVGDKVNATLTERLVIFVRSGSEDLGVTHAAALATAPKGAKPGAMVAEMYEIVASVKSIDSATRIAILQFSEGQTRSVHVRPDVELSRYKVGDRVVIRVTSTLSVLVENP